MTRYVLIFRYLVQIERSTHVKFFINDVATFGMTWSVIKCRLIVHKSTNVKPTVGFFHKNVIFIRVINFVASYFKFTLLVRNVLTLSSDLWFV